MRPEVDKSFREGLMRQEGDSSFNGVENTSKDADDLVAAFEGTSSTVRARERATVKEGESLLLSPDAAGRMVAGIEVCRVEDGRRIRCGTSVSELASEDGDTGSGLITVIPVEFGDNGEATIGAGVVRGLG